jgi:hypothetical protein
MSLNCTFHYGLAVTMSAGSTGTAVIPSDSNSLFDHLTDRMTDKEVIDTGIYLNAIASASLDALTFFLADALRLRHTSSGSNPASRAPSRASSPRRQAALSLAQDNELTVPSSGNGLIDCLSNVHAVESIKFMMSILPRGNARYCCEIYSPSST